MVMTAIHRDAFIEGIQQLITELEFRLIPLLVAKSDYKEGKILMIRRNADQFHEDRRAIDIEIKFIFEEIAYFEELISR